MTKFVGVERNINELEIDFDRTGQLPEKEKDRKALARYKLIMLYHLFLQRKYGHSRRIDPRFIEGNIAAAIKLSPDDPMIEIIKGMYRYME